MGRLVAQVDCTNTTETSVDITIENPERYNFGHFQFIPSEVNTQAMTARVYGSIDGGNNFAEIYDSGGSQPAQTSLMAENQPLFKNMRVSIQLAGVSTDTWYVWLAERDD